MEETGTMSNEQMLKMARKRTEEHSVGPQSKKGYDAAVKEFLQFAEGRGYTKEDLLGGEEGDAAN
jgi:hypothetical protein